MKFGHIKKGDTVKRRMGTGGPLMPMVVVHVDDELVYCDLEPERPMSTYGRPLNQHWMFDRETGVEEDSELGWGKRFRKAGTWLEAE